MQLSKISLIFLRFLIVINPLQRYLNAKSDNLLLDILISIIYNLRLFYIKGIPFLNAFYVI